MTAVRINAAPHRLREARIDFHDRKDHRRKYRSEEHSGLCRLDRTVDRIKNSIAEYAVAIEVVGDRDIKYLIEIPEFPVRTAQNGQPKDNACRKEDGCFDGAVRKYQVVGHCCRITPDLTRNSIGVSGQNECSQNRKRKSPAERAPARSWGTN